MKPEEKLLLIDTAKKVDALTKQYKDLNVKLTALLDVYYRTNFPDRMVINKKVDITDELSVKSKVAFYGLAPIAQQASIPDPAGGATVDAEARTAINSILDVLDAFGFTA